MSHRDEFYSKGDDIVNNMQYSSVPLLNNSTQSDSTSQSFKTDLYKTIYLEWLSSSLYCHRPPVPNQILWNAVTQGFANHCNTSERCLAASIPALHHNWFPQLYFHSSINQLIAPTQAKGTFYMYYVAVNLTYRLWPSNLTQRVSLSTTVPRYFV